ncbi:hypothetical protein [Paractinoplanes rishiriensis]|uniref:hypothetical protein n=1 Tax=Paractinoplanes rishiriensis TaxID=1050105 RepID=UPI00194569C6|nr:hypothetical protein [Actinoplanes rishiriensis]
MPPDIGSEFHWDPSLLTGGGPPWLPPRHELFATGCGALAALLLRLSPAGRLHLPTYFCIGVAEWLSARIPIAWYRHLPDGRGPRWETLRVRDGDLVLAQNLFGRDDGSPWLDWMRAHPGIVVVEDHSHDPVGEWARASQAPYALASLRKTLPVPDGGLLWSPRGLDLPRPAGGASPGTELKLAGMLLKAAWLAGRPVPRETFRSLQGRGEGELLGSGGPAHALTAAALPLLDAYAIRRRDAANARALTAALSPKAASQPDISPTPAISPAVDASGWRLLGAGPFRVQLLCRSQNGRDALLRHLAAHHIFAPVHWRQDRTAFWSGDPEAAALADRMLTLPVDHRCSPADVRRTAEVLRAAAESAAQRRPATGPAPAA